MRDPLLKRAQLGYWLAWVPLAALVAMLLVSGGLGWFEAANSALHLCLVHALVCRSSWYMCRSLPLTRTRLPRLLLTYALAAGFAAGLWVGLISLYAQLLPSDWRAGLLGLRLGLAGLGAVFFLLSVAFHYLVLGMQATRLAEQREAASRILAREAELKALRAQVNPHFLFNSLNAVAALTTGQPAAARQMCLNLSAFLRSTLKLGDREEVELAEELALVREYLAVEQVRFGPRLEVRERIDPACLGWAVPPLLLQPLVENALKHGLGGLPEGGWVELGVGCRDERLCIWVANPYDPQAPPAAGTGRGLRLLRDRLETRYATAVDLRQSRAEAVWRVELRLPRLPPPGGA